MNNDDAQKQPEAPALNGEVGNQLRKAREAKGMSVAQVADAQHLRPSVIQAIEEGQYEKIGSELFLKGYVRTYAEQVGLDPAEVIEKLDWELEPMRQQAEEERYENPLENIERRKQKKRKVARWIMLCLLLVAAAVVGMRLLDSNMLPIGGLIGGSPVETVDEPSEASSSEDSPAAESDADEAPAPVVDDGVVGGTDDSGPPESPEQEAPTVEATESTTVPAEPEATSESEESAAEAPAQSETPITEAEPPEPASSQEPLVTSSAQEEQGEEQGADTAETQDRASETEAADEATTPPEESVATANADVLSASFTGDCWVSVENGAGQTVIASLKRAGDNLNYEGQGPFRVVLGAADAATLSFNGEVVDLSRYPAPNNRVALTLGN